MINRNRNQMCCINTDRWVEDAGTFDKTWMGRLKLLQQQQANALINYVNVDMMAMIVNKTTYFLDTAS